MAQVEVTLSIIVDGQPEEFTASGDSSGSPWELARQLGNTVDQDSKKWTYQCELAAEKAARDAASRLWTEVA